MRRLIVILSLLLCCAGASAAIRLHGGSTGAPVGGACPYGTTFADGCPGAPVGGNIQYSDFFTSRALQSSQSYQSGTFTGSIAGAVLTVSSFAATNGNALAVNQTIIGSGVPTGTIIGSLGTGAGGNGTYNLLTAGVASNLTLSGSMSGLIRPPWNVVCVDYACGIPAASFPLKVPGVNAVPTGCSYSGVTHTVTCNVAATDVVFDGWDFGANNCTFLKLANPFSGSLTITNSNFKWGTNCGNIVAIVNLGDITASSPALTVSNSVFDGVGTPWTYVATATTVATTNLGGINGNTTVNITYSEFIHCPGRCITSSGFGSFVMNYDYLEGMTYPVAQVVASISGSTLCVTSFVNGTGTIANASPVQGTGVAFTSITSSTGSCAGTAFQIDVPQTVSSRQMSIFTKSHGDAEQFTGGTGGTSPLYQKSYNVCWEPVDSTGTTSCSVPNNLNNTTNTLTSWQVDHSVFVANKLDDAWSGVMDRVGTSFLIGDQNAFTIGSVNWDTNYIDPTGATGCMFLTASKAPVPTLTGNVNLLDNSAAGSTTSSAGLITLANPTVINWVGHGLPAGAIVLFGTAGTLPSHIAVSTNYFVKTAGLAADTFQISATGQGGAAVDTSADSQSGVQTIAAPGNPCNGHG